MLAELLAELKYNYIGNNIYTRVIHSETELTNISTNKKVIDVCDILLVIIVHDDTITDTYIQLLNNPKFRTDNEINFIIRTANEFQSDIDYLTGGPAPDA